MAQKDYETLFIIKPDLSEEETETEFGKLTRLIQDHGGVILEEDRIGKRRLSYPVKKQRYGFYGLVRFSLDPAGLAELEKLYRFNENILKNLIVYYDAAAGRIPEGAEEAAVASAENGDQKSAEEED